MAGIRDEVELDVTAALRSIDQIGASLNRQVNEFQVSLSKGLDQLRAGPAISGGSTEALVQASTAARSVKSDIDKVTTSTNEATAATGKYGTALEAVAQVRVVQGLVAFFGGRALIGQINDAVQAASSLNEQVSQSEQIFGAAAAQIQKFGDTAETSVALARGQAIAAANDFGNLFRSQGLGAQAAADMSEQFVKLASDIASFKDIPISEALLKIRSGLVGEAEPLRTIGAGFTDVEVQAKALALGFHEVDGAFSQLELTQARAAIILDKTRLAQGDLARTSDGLANQQRILAAEMGRAREEIGALLLPVMLQLTATLRDQLPELQELATNAVPLLVAAMHTVIPIGTSLLSTFVALSPVLETLATIVSSIPAPILAAAAAFAAFSRFGVPFFGTATAAAGAIRNLFLEIRTNPGGGLAGLSAGLSAINPTALAAGAGITLLTTILSNNAQRARETKAANDALRTSYEDLGKSVSSINTSLVQTQLQSRNQVDDINRLGLTYEDLAKQLETGTGSVAAFTQRLIDSGQASLGVGYDGAGEKVKTVTELIERYGSIKKAVDDGALRGNGDLAVSYEKLANSIQKNSKDALDSLVASKAITQSAVDSAIKANTVDGVTNFAAVLSSVRPAAEDAAAGVETLGGATTTTASSMDALDAALKKVKDSLDSTFGKYLDAEAATEALQTAVHGLGEELGKGQQKGQPLLDYQNSLRDKLHDTAQAVEDNALAMARAGQIGNDQASITAEMVNELQILEATFPGLKDQIDDYINLLLAVPPTITTTVSVQLDQAFNINNFDAIFGNEPVDAGKSVANQIRDGIRQNLDQVANAGRQAGAAAATSAKEEAVSVLKSADSGFDIGGFLVQGIILDPGQQASRDLNNFFALATKGIGSTVADAMRIDPSEQQAILEALQKVAQDSIALGKARDELGGDSIEAAIAAQQLAQDEANVNKVIIDATDSTEAYTAALKRLADGVDSVTGAFHALEDAQKSQQDVADAQKDVDDTTARLGLLDRTIADRQARLAGTTDPVQVRRLQETIANLQQQRNAQAGTVQDAQTKLVDAQIGLVDSQQKIVDAAQAAEKSQGQWEEYFRNLAGAAGLSQAAVDSLVQSLERASSTTSAIKTGILTGNPVGGATNPLQGSLLGAAPSGPNYYISITESDGPRQTAQEIINETRAVALTAG